MTRAGAGLPCGVLHDFHALPEAAYAYLLGMYLGDGYISRGGRSWRLRIACDTKYAAIINRCREAIDAVLPVRRAALVKRKGNCVEVSLYSNHWPYLFPQHGPGRKHNRRIALQPWQQEIVDREAATARMDEFIGPKDCAVPLAGVHYAT